MDVFYAQIGNIAACEIWRDIALFLLGALSTGAVSYFTLWGAFAKDAVTRTELKMALDEQSRQFQSQFDFITQALNRIGK